MTTRTRLLATAAALALPALAAPGLASAAPTLDGSYAVSGTPGEIARGADGNMWVALSGGTSDLAKVTPAGVVTEYDDPDLPGLVGLTAGPDGNLWATRSGNLVKIPPADPTTATQVPAAEIADPRGIATGADGNLWAASGDKLVRMTPAGVKTVYTNAGMSARGVAAGGDGNIYIADFGGNVVKATPSGAFGGSPVGGGPQDVAALGGQMVYSNPGSVPQTVGRLSFAGAVSPVNTAGDPFGVTEGGDGAAWYANFASQDLGRLTADGSYTKPVSFPAASGPRQLAAGPSNTLWVSLETSKRVARVTGVEAPPATGGTTTTGGGTTGGTTGIGPTVTRDLLAPVLSKAKVNARKRRLTLRLSEAAVVRVQIAKKRRGRYRIVRRLTLDAPAGTSTVRLGRTFTAGSYRIIAVATDEAGNAGRPGRVALRVKR